MALITRNASYLVYELDFSYWCLSDVDFTDLKILEISQAKMLISLELTETYPLQLISAVSSLDKKLWPKLAGNYQLSNQVRFVKKVPFGRNGFDLELFKSKGLTEQQINELKKNLNNEFATNDGKWIGDSSLDFDDESVLQFCRNNVYFAFKLINERNSTKKDLLCIEKCDVNFGNLIIETILKMCGVLFKDVDPSKRPKTRKFTLITYNRYTTSEMKIIYPTSENFSIHSTINTQKKNSVLNIFIS